MTPIQQFGLLKHEYPESIGSVKKGILCWTGNFTPSVLSDTYKLRIVYKANEYPAAYIVSPKPLPLAPGTAELPHTYNYNDGKQQLCLFWPSRGEWNPSMSIATTVVHWAVQWMYYYELWLATGKWLGGGHGDWDAKDNDCNQNNTKCKSSI